MIESTPGPKKLVAVDGHCVHYTKACDDLVMFREHNDNIVEGLVLANELLFFFVLGWWLVSRPVCLLSPPSQVSLMTETPALAKPSTP